MSSVMTAPRELQAASYPKLPDEETGLRSWLLTTDHKRIALLYFASITVFFFLGGCGGGADAAEPGRAAGRDHVARELQPRVHPARRGHGVVLPGAGGPGDARQLHPAADARRARPRLPAPEPDELVPVHDRRPADRLGAADGRARHRLDVLHAALDQLHAKATWCWRCSASFMSGFSSIATGLNFIVTIHRLRAPGMAWYRMPVFVWSLYATSVIYVLARRCWRSR